MIYFDKRSESRLGNSRAFTLEDAMEESTSARLRYAELIRGCAHLRSERLVSALADVARENYLGPGPWKILRPPNFDKYEDTPDANPAQVYDDVLVALDPARSLNNGHPSSLCAWIDALDLQEGETVVHAGCGTGYYTAVIAHVVGDTGHVTAIEFDHELAARAKAYLAEFRCVEVISGDASIYDTGEADAIFINAGATHPLPLWLDNLKPRGRLLFPLTQGSESSVPIRLGVMMRVQRLAAGYEANAISPVGIFPCVGAIDAEADRLVGKVFAEGGFARVRSLRRDEHVADEYCALHGRGYCFSTTYAS
jgi:protein-L-isoaspartate(D-aspartate) O-methyltransferase